MKSGFEMQFGALNGQINLKVEAGLSLEVSDGEFNSSRCQASSEVSYGNRRGKTCSLSVSLGRDGNYCLCFKQPTQTRPIRSDSSGGKQ